MSLANLTLMSVAVASLVLLRVALGNRMWTKVGTYFILVVCTFHVGSEVVNLIAGDRNKYRTLVGSKAIEDWLMVIAPAIMVLTLSYLLTLGGGCRRQPVRSSDETIHFLDWKYYVLATLPLYLLAVQGVGFVPDVNDVQSGYFSTGVTTQFLQIGICLAAYAFIIQTGRLFLAVSIQSVAFILLGQRLPIVAGLMALFFLLARRGYVVSRRQMCGIVALALVGALILSSARLTVGRQDFAGGVGPSSRFAAVLSGVGGLTSSDNLDALADDYVYRIDGNAFPALILSRQNEGQSGTGLATVVNGTYLAIPSFLFPEKLQRQVEERSEKAYLGSFYSIRVNEIDYLPTILGVTVSYYGAPVVLFFAALIGIMLGGLDRWLLTDTSARTIVACGAMLTLLYYERGFDVIPITGRGVVSVAVLVWIFHIGRNVLVSIGHGRARVGMSSGPAGNLPVIERPSRSRSR